MCDEHADGVWETAEASVSTHQKYCRVNAEEDATKDDAVEKDMMMHMDADKLWKKPKMSSWLVSWWGCRC